MISVAFSIIAFVAIAYFAKKKLHEVVPQFEDDDDDQQQQPATEELLEMESITSSSNGVSGSSDCCDIVAQDEKGDHIIDVTFVSAIPDMQAVELLRAEDRSHDSSTPTPR